MATAYPCECGDEPALFTLSSHSTGDTLFLGQQCLTAWAMAWLEQLGLDTSTLLPAGVVDRPAGDAASPDPQVSPGPVPAAAAAGGDPGGEAGVGPSEAPGAPGGTARPNGPAGRRKAASGPSRAASGQPATSSTD